MTIDWGTVLPVIVGTLAVIAGWPIVHKLNLRREIAAEKRKLRISYLLEAYRKIESASNRPHFENRHHGDAIESAIADIQLLGTPEQVKLAQSLAAEFAERGGCSFDPLLLNMRDSLRGELDLEPVDGDLRFLRIIQGK